MMRIGRLVDEAEPGRSNHQRRTRGAPFVRCTSLQPTRRPALGVTRATMMSELREDRARHNPVKASTTTNRSKGERRGWSGTSAVLVYGSDARWIACRPSIDEKLKCTDDAAHW